MLRRLIRIALTTAATLALCSSALASVIYTYTGAQYTLLQSNQLGPAPATYTTAMSTTGTITLANALGANLTNQALNPLDFSFSDGVHAYTFANSGGSPNTYFLKFSTNALGQITGWLMNFDDSSAIAPGGDFFDLTSQTTKDVAVAARCALNTTPGQCNPVSGFSTAENEQGGTWSGPTLVTVPEPGVLSLMALGLFAMGGRRRRTICA